MSRWTFTKGLHDLGNGCLAYLQPDGGWGYSNAGLIVDGDRTLLVDTLFDKPLTAEMLASMRSAIPAAKRIDRVVNTHAHPDHTAGNALVADSEIIASLATFEDMKRMSEGVDPIQKIMTNWQNFGEAGAYLHEVMGSRFDIAEREHVLPTRHFDSEMDLTVGDKQVHLKKIGPAHSRGDTLVHVPKDRILFSGDVLFNQVHPAIVSVNIANWIEACDHVLTLDVDVIVPGHGPIADLNAVRTQRDYLQYFQVEARKRFDAGMPVAEAALDISIDAFRGWADEERIFITVANLYQSFGAPPPPMLDMMALAGRYRRDKMACGPGCTHQHHSHTHGG
ncbi:MBL fold metallo-hydrolase [Azospirillum griseum]|uniref:MBL fold metallo-hydrolase n=1 Tax=Azospirillum griseum TaxID=2496639 RepID=A0A3S0HTX8_9PROT|nr:MBL fold metallo-hydrolase [Azospirillum griseum]RTR14620.1 MBL fold metallo-hydrolase [Azospirillum griseum]